MCPQHGANGRPRSPVGAVPSTAGEERTAFELELGIEAPAVEDGDPGADVADGDHEVVGVVRRVRDSLAAGHEEPDVVLEADLDRRVVGTGRDEQWSLAGEEGLLG